MPIRASERARYPADWKAISARIKARSGGRCECQGECGLHPPQAIGAYVSARRCEERQGEPARWAKGFVVLTVAHLGDPSPENCSDDNLKAMCQRCHLRYDQPLHQRHAAETRRAKKQNYELFAPPSAPHPPANKE
jgi:hypothetical protein